MVGVDAGQTRSKHTIESRVICYVDMIIVVYNGHDAIATLPQSMFIVLNKVQLP